MSFDPHLLKMATLWHNGSTSASRSNLLKMFIVNGWHLITCFVHLLHLCRYIMIQSLAVNLEIGTLQPVGQTWPMFMSNILLEHSHVCSFTCCLWMFFYCNTDVRSRAETILPANPIIYYLALYKAY